MAAAITTETQADTARPGKVGTRRAAGTGRKRGVAHGESSGTTRFFLGKANGRLPVLDRELLTENEALLESLKTGQSYFAVSERRAFADLSKEVPQIRKEEVRRKEQDHGLETLANGRSGVPAQAL
jgi:hypothetical protein